MVYSTVEKYHSNKYLHIDSEIAQILNELYEGFEFNSCTPPRYYAALLQTPKNVQSLRLTRIEKVINENSEVKTFLFHFPEIARSAFPGQFIMTNVFQKFKNNKYKFQPDELPMSLSYVAPDDGVIGITCKRVGEGTKALHRHKVGDFVGLRGPYGQGFQTERMRDYVAVIGGGIGIAPLIPLGELLRKENKKFKILIGVKKKEELLFTKKIKELDPEFQIATENGSGGFRGQVTALFRELLNSEPFTDMAVCGPEKMIRESVEIAGEYGVSLQASLERYMKCGRGICGHCSIDGLLVCKDGPVFAMEILDKLESLGKYKKDACGIRKQV